MMEWKEIVQENLNKTYLNVELMEEIIEIVINTSHLLPHVGPYFIVFYLNICVREE